jgi:hypothetical protein
MNDSERPNNHQATDGPIGASARSRSAIGQLRKRLKMLRSYHEDTLAHRAGDVELAVETVIFEQLMRSAKASAPEQTSTENQDLKHVLEDVQSAIEQIAAQQENHRDERERLLEQHARLVHVTDALSLKVDHWQPAIHDSSKVDLAEHERVVTQFAMLRSEYDELLDFMESDRSRCASAQSDVAHEEVESLHRQIVELQSELEAARMVNGAMRSSEFSDLIDATCGNQSNDVDILRRQLLEERQKIVDLRLQVDDLNLSLSKAPSQSSGPAAMSWDEQKAMLLAKLEGEVNDDVLDPSKPLELKSIIEKTNREIERRDKEIAQMRQLLAEQATASQSIAIGAAAVAELLDHDDFKATFGTR